MGRKQRGKVFENQDPHYQREAEKYQEPVPSREFILASLEQHGRPIAHKKLLALLECDSEQLADGVTNRLKAMLRDGQIMVDRRSRYCLIDKLALLKGTVIAHPDGYGFVKPDDGSEDRYLSSRNMQFLWHGDRILFRDSGEDRRGRLEATVVEITERRTTRVVGRYHETEGVGYVEAINKRQTQSILISSANLQDSATPAVKIGQMAVVSIVAQPTRSHQAIGVIESVLGDYMAPGMEIEVALRSWDLPHTWSTDADFIVASFAPPAKKDFVDRTSLCHLPFVTIDGEDSKDFDDAVYAEPVGTGYKLLVAIADVSHYVERDTSLDKEAYARGNSVYFPNYVVPMLPERLANDLCSLNAKVDRLVLVAELSINAKGKLENYSFFEGVIHSHARLTYTEVAVHLGLLQGTTAKLPNELNQPIKHLYNLYGLLKKARQEEGAIDFDVPESKIIFDENRKIAAIKPMVRNEAHKIIEECMLVANIAAAKFLAKSKLPILYRVHEPPNLEKLLHLRAFLKAQGFNLKGGETPTLKDFSTVLAAAETHNAFPIMQKLMLRSMSLAVYQPKNLGHFGLAFQAYTHFTSPIRRYPDLLVHRAIKHVLLGKSKKEYPYSESEMELMGEHCSMTDRRADEAVWDVLGWLKCEYMQDKIGKHFMGTVSGVTHFGLFITLDEVYVDGLLHITALPSDYYHYDKAHVCLTGERTGRRFQMGDRLPVLVAAVDLDERKIVFESIEND